MGDPHKMILMETALNVIKEESLIDNMVKQGEKLLTGLKEIQVCVRLLPAVCTRIIQVFFVLTIALKLLKLLCCEL